MEVGENIRCKSHKKKGVILAIDPKNNIFKFLLKLEDGTLMWTNRRDIRHLA